jgi:carboxymethylenebutenolidase
MTGASHRGVGAALTALAAALLPVPVNAQSATVAPQTVSFDSGTVHLHGLIYKPAGSGPFPAVLYNHGSAPGLTNNAAFEAIAPAFLAHGWIFFAPYRRGQGLSQSAGAYIMDEINAARARGGMPAAAQTLVRLLRTEQLDDQMAALSWLRRQPFVRPTRIAVMGNSFGGIETVLGAARADYCAAVDAAGGAESWDVAPGLRSLMTQAAQGSSAPLFLLQAENDYNLSPSRVLYAAARAAGRPAEIHLYPRFGDTAAAGHSFAWRGVAIWKDDVLRFLERNCTR